MHRGKLGAAVAVTAAAVLALTACGSKAATSSPPAATAASVPASAAPVTPDPVAEHDRKFPDVAALNCASATPTATATASAPPVPVDPWAQKYVENNGFKQAMPMNAVAQCRGTAHAARINAALKAHPAATAEELLATLDALGYPAKTVAVSQAPSSVGFSLFVPDTGPCISRAAGAPTATPHGPYPEGGCTRPTGGH